MPGPPTTSVWDDNLLANPHTVADKRGRVQQMFAAIAPSYDLNNRLHSLWRDQAWRRAAVRMADVKPTDQVVDVACGTGDLALAFAEKLSNPRQVIGIDFTYEMLPLARQKARDRKILWINGDAQALPLEDSSCDVLSIAFGIRNVADPAAAMQEFHRVLRPEGRLIILEFSLPTNPILRHGYNLYFRHILPRTATWISGDRTGAYKYLPQSVNTFINPQIMSEMMAANGFSDIVQKPLTFGISVCYRGRKHG
ncbi:MAG: bifunctional demethylmenaquinone methyltransferase/2-methoxy-6-polyprenyl-1,4-benzoquinol methylase UbiE [Tepidisphaeraceae bacterium]|jgi:demethylmenaquinone methyltransferase/2-methoxy-6-polyprenyl-1,4-benzoquinol methylase